MCRPDQSSSRRCLGTATNGQNVDVPDEVEPTVGRHADRDHQWGHGFGRLYRAAVVGELAIFGAVLFLARWVAWYCPPPVRLWVFGGILVTGIVALVLWDRHQARTQPPGKHERGHAGYRR